MSPDERREASRRNLTIRAELAEIDAARSFLRQTLAPFRPDEEEIFKLELALVEVCVNITRYAYRESSGPIRISLWTQPEVSLEIRDSGRPFDPRLVPPPDLESLALSGRRGGLGVYLARKLVDEFSYRRDGDENVLTLTRALPVAG